MIPRRSARARAYITTRHRAPILSLDPGNAQARIPHHQTPVPELDRDRRRDSKPAANPVVINHPRHRVAYGRTLLLFSRHRNRINPARRPQMTTATPFKPKLRPSDSEKVETMIADMSIAYGRAPRGSANTHAQADSDRKRYLPHDDPSSAYALAHFLTTAGAHPCLP
ncbi:hypothetical protein EJ03DRAFT_185017 [Teratosphaeria nubilosa]|uniref:Uncharacterized protein n=1 Tax=Teratosphaeria nubilosa TaxID=161662 RepID=A0A6G1KZY0_9PEZI|nr:hypothetical protein EJ03DRAFT_185017 [Teratosphaeria nubilosa]